MTSKKLGALLRSVPPATAVAYEGPPAEQSNAPRAQRNTAEREVPLQVLIPERIRKQLGVKAAEEGKSLRELMLTAIRSLGIEVTVADIKGKRGRRNS